MLRVYGRQTRRSPSDVVADSRPGTGQVDSRQEGKRPEHLEGDIVLGGMVPNRVVDTAQGDTVQEGIDLGNTGQVGRPLEVGVPRVGIGLEGMNLGDMLQGGRHQGDMHQGDDHDHGDHVSWPSSVPSVVSCRPS
jgi:hypothetical protein